MDECADAGLGTRSESGEIRDIFRGRLMFPIRNPRGRVIGFGGRALGESGPKYINSPQSPIFDKSATLYGADRAREAARQADRVVVVEGYMDVITAHQFGFQNVVASMGTALTKEQANVLKRISKRVSLALDADTAGQQATLRSLLDAFEASLRRPHNIRIRGGSAFLEGPPASTYDIILMPAGEDPDSIIRKDGDNWVSLTESAIPFIDYFMQSAVSKVDLNAPGALSFIVDSLRPILVTEDFLEQDARVRKLASLMRVSEDSLRVAINNPGKRSLRQPRAPSSPRRTQQAENAGPTPRRIDVLGEHVLAIIVQNPDLVSEMETAVPEWFIDHSYREIFKKLVSGFRPDYLTETESEDLGERLNGLQSKRLLADGQDHLLKDLREATRNLEIEYLRMLKLEEKKLLEDQESLGDMEEAIDQHKLSINQGF